MLKSKCDEEHSFKHSMIRSYVIETFDHSSVLLSGDLKLKCLLKTWGGESCCSLRVIESRTLQIKILLLFEVEQKQHGDRHGFLQNSPKLRKLSRQGTKRFKIRLLDTPFSAA